MSNLPNAEQSPRVVNGVIKWYEGDTFDLTIGLDLEDQDGSAVTLAAADTVEVVFLDRSEKEVKRFTFSNVQGSAVTLDFSAAVTALFGKGQYTYDIYLTHGGERTTIANDNKAVVE